MGISKPVVRAGLGALAIAGLSCLLLVTGACVPMSGRRAPDHSQPLKSTAKPPPLPAQTYDFDRCASISTSKGRERAFSAMLLSLHERDWIVEKMSFSSGDIVARGCLRNHPKGCVSMLFSADQSGSVEAKHYGIHPPSGSLEDDLERWMVALESTFSKFRCYTDEALDAEMAKYGF
jgi:hypothetical protein